MWKNYYLILTLFLLTIVSLSCKEDEIVKPPDNPPVKAKTEIKMTIDDVASTDLYIKIELSDTLKNNTINICRDNKPVLTFHLSGKDTLLLDTNLKPNCLYHYTAYLKEDSINVDTSGSVTANTMDTTSHNIIWTEYRVQGVGGLYDVGIIDENNIWAVGGIEKVDTNYVFWNRVRWDGSRWNYENVYTNDTTWGIRKAIFVLNRNNIMMGGGYPMYWDGSKFKMIRYPDNVMPTWTNGIWVTDKDNFYIVGDSGNAAHYSNGIWNKLNTQTRNNLQDVYGTTDGRDVWACGNQIFSVESVLLHIKDNTVTKYYENVINNDVAFITSLWVKNKRLYYLSNLKIFMSPADRLAPAKMDVQFPKSGIAVRGNNVNDIFVAADCGYIYHYNGSTSHRYNEMYNPNHYIMKMCVKDNTIVIVGWDTNAQFGNKIFIIIGKRT